MRGMSFAHFGRRSMLGLGLAFAAMTCQGCDNESSSATQTSVSANQPAKKAPSSMVIPVEEKPAATATPKAPKKKPEDCPKGNTLSLDDPDLEAALRLKLQKDKGELTKADLRRLTSLNLSQTKVRQLDICLFPYMTNLKELFLGPGDLDDLSPIANSTKLETLRASLNQVSDLSPLANMTKMDRLDLGRTQVKDLTPLKGMTALTELVIDSTPVEDLTPLSEMKDLENLSIKRTRVKDVSPLKDLKKLKFIYVADTPADEDPMNFAPLRANGTKVISM